MNIEIFYWRSLGNVIHRGARIDGGPRLTAEGCNFDDSRRWESHHIGDLVIEGSRDCTRCLPDEQIYGVPA